MDLYLNWATQDAGCFSRCKDTLAYLQIKPEHRATVLRDLLLFVECTEPGRQPWARGQRQLQKVAKAWVGEFKAGRVFWGPHRHYWWRPGELVEADGDEVSVEWSFPAHKEDIEWAVAKLLGRLRNRFFLGFVVSSDPCAHATSRRARHPVLGHQSHNRAWSHCVDVDYKKDVTNYRNSSEVSLSCAGS